ncbi:MAG: site-specific integrase [Actinobacteria bacterium]|nr:site-specific integrase [Actinomycetota bacterium]
MPGSSRSRGGQRSPTTVSPLVELAEDWLAAKSLGSSSAGGHSETARRSDLARIGRAVCVTLGRPTDEARNYDLERDLGPVRLEDLSADTVLRTAAFLKASYSPATARRTLSTLNGFARWLFRRGHLADDPCDQDELVLPRRSEGDGAAFAFLPEEVTAMRAAAAAPPANARSSWAARDVAIVDVLAGCGLRAAECCAAQVGDFDLRLERPVLHLRHGVKGGKRRDVPVPRSVLESCERWTSERHARFRKPAASALLFVRNNGRPLDDAWLDRLVVRLARQSGVAMRDQVAAHGFRHHFGTQLALRRVAPAVIQELMGHTDPRTTAIYTRSVASHLVDALDDAGWL